MPFSSVGVTSIVHRSRFLSSTNTNAFAVTTSADIFFGGIIPSSVTFSYQPVRLIGRLITQCTSPIETVDGGYRRNDKSCGHPYEETAGKQNDWINSMDHPMSFAIGVSMCSPGAGLLACPTREHLSAHYFTSSISPGFQVLSNHGSSGPYNRRIVNQPLPGTV